MTNLFRRRRRFWRWNRNNGFVVLFIGAVVVSIIAGMSSSFQSSKFYGRGMMNRNKHQLLPRQWRTTTTVPPFVFVRNFSIPPTKLLTDISTDTSTSSSEEDDVNCNDTNIPFFASTASTTSSKNQNRTTTKIARGEQDRMLTRRDAVKYSTVLSISSLLTGAAYTRTNHLAKEESSPPKRPSFIPEPVLKSISTKELAQSKNHVESTSTKATKPKTTTTATTITTQPKKLVESATTAASKQKTTTIATTQPKKPIESATTTAIKPKPKTTATTTTILNTGQIEPVNLTQIVSETNINVTVKYDKESISIDSNNFTFNKVAKPKVPKWLPSFLTPGPQVVKKMSNNELLVAATVAGSITEMGRTLLLHPLQTIKIRGDLYAGISPTLLVSVPATGIYYGVRDVTKRMLYMMPTISETWISVLAAAVADVASLCFRTPSETLAIRLQNNNETLGDWFGDSYDRLPMVIATDLPYLLSKIVLNRMLIQGTISVSDYAEYAVLAAVVAGFLSTPFDVARTRILLDKQLVLWDDDDDDDEADDAVDVDQPTTPVIANTRPGYSVLQTMIQITKEGDGGIKNLYAGWLERVLYLGIGRAWLEPVQLIGYIGIRDTILLEWF
ncbi:mitochondrial carrier [Fragilariopsis cylindrus CCMP1102]|uniref:Mitochondrial carrier n=1 Tax=Fragilariopsis cylindrus CCMP1102 TaxID=635003 RepID=A0A1E7F380_9STRA|nr:mitochondrial carrier [Fragilariopsis cylindrus CCMP1102]|eukprot:OEU12630.1 mitochondrial carrier [Fragilariopsis cylindrus CCMP1102]